MTQKFIYNPNNEKTHYVGVTAMQDNTGQYNWERCFLKQISENSYFQTFAINCFRENQSACV